MIELIFNAFGLLIAFLFLMAIGHFCWLGCAAVVRWCTGQRRSASVEQPKRCAVCGGDVRDSVCLGCGFEFATPLSARADVLAVARQLRYWFSIGALTRDEFRKLFMRLVAAYQRDQASAALPHSWREVLRSLEEVPATAARRDGEVSWGQSEPPRPEAPPLPQSAEPVRDEVPQFADSEVAEDEVAEDEVVEASLSADERESEGHANPPVWEDARNENVALSEPTVAMAVPVHPLDRDEPEPIPSVKRRTLGEFLQAFMEEKNIRWGEVVSGILIVGCAIGLVVSLRATLLDLSEQVPYFPALLFLLGSAAIHAAGWYSLKRWNLQSTSRGLLVIACLLIPLNFFASILLAGAGEAKLPLTHPMFVVAVLAGISGYGAITWVSSRLLAAGQAWRLLIAIMVPSACQILFNRLPVDGSLSQEMLVALMSLPSLALGVALFVNSRDLHARPAFVNELLMVLGVGVFSVLVSWAVLLSVGVVSVERLAVIGPAAALGSTLIGAFGWRFHQDLESSKLPGARFIGTALALLGVVGQLYALWLSWPDPDLMIATLTVNGSAVLLLCWVARSWTFLPIATVHLGLAGILGVEHWLWGRLENVTNSSELLRAVWRVDTAFLLAGMAVISRTLESLMRRSRSPVEFALALQNKVSSGYFAVAVVMSVLIGFRPLLTPWLAEVPDRDYASCLLVLAGAVLFILESSRKQVGNVGLGWTLITMASLQAMVLNESFRMLMPSVEVVQVAPWASGFLSSAMLAAATMIVLGRSSSKARSTDVMQHVSQTACYLLVGLSLSATLFSPQVTLRPAAMLFGLQAALVLLTAVSNGNWTAWLGGQMLAVASAFCTLTFMRHAATIWEVPWDSAQYGNEVLITIGSLATLFAALALLPAWPQALRGPANRPSGELVGLVAASLVLMLRCVAECWSGILVELGVSVPDEAELAQQPWYSLSAWLAVIVLTVGTSLTALRRVTSLTQLSWVLLAITVALFVCGPFEEARATASMFRWALATYTLLGTTAYAMRSRLGRVVARLRVEWDPGAARYFRNLLIVVGAAPILTITIWTVVRVLTGAELGGPVAESFFGRMPVGISFAVPLLTLVVSYAWLAVVDQDEKCLALASGVFQLSVLLSTLLVVQNWTSTQTQGVALLQAWVCSWGAFSLIWISLFRLRLLQLPDGGISVWCGQHVRIALAMMLLYSLVCVSGWLPFPLQVASAYRAQMGTWPSYAAILLPVIALLAQRQDTIRWGTLTALAVAPLLVVVASSVENASGYAAAQVLQGLSLALLGLTGIITLDRERRFDPSPTVGTAANFGWGTVLALAHVLVFRLAVDGSLTPEAKLLQFSIATAATTWIAWVRPLPGLRYLSLLTAVGVAILLPWSLIKNQWLDEIDTFSAFLGTFVLLNAVWHVLDWSAVDKTSKSRLLPATTLVTYGLVGGYLVLLVLGYGIGIVVNERVPWHLSYLAVPSVALACLLLGSLWFRDRAYPLWLSYFQLLTFELILLSWATDAANATRGDMLAWGVVTCSAHLAFTGQLWKRGGNLAEWAARLGIRDPIRYLAQSESWLVAVTLVFATILLAIELLGALVLEERGNRMLLAFGPLLAGYGIGCLGQERRRALRTVALLSLPVSFVLLGWADVPNQWRAATYLTWSCRTLISLAASALVLVGALRSGLPGVQLWRDELRTVVRWIVSSSLAALGAVLILEVVSFVPGEGCDVATPMVLVVGGVLLALGVSLFAIAAIPHRFNLALSESGRHYYVYGAQAVVALSFAHVFLCRPMWFDSMLRPYWPFIVLTLGFAGVGAAEALRRQGWNVLADPLFRTGFCLPLIPTIGFWIVASHSSYAGILFTIGLFYLVISLTRPSLLSIALAVLAGNGALWSLMYEAGWNFLTNPQAWLIPPAVCVLIAVHVNRDRLTRIQLVSLRYLSAIVIYTSSAGEMFLRGIGENFWSPVILATLSVVGVLLGILLRIRPFLYLGVSFLLLSIVGMVWHASVHIQHSWPWWVFGIAMGILILTMFAIFEKRKQDVLKVVQQVKSWDK